MKRPSTASAALNFLNQGFSIEISVQTVGAFTRYIERNKPGFELNISYENDMAVLTPAKQAMEVPSLKASLKAGLEKAGLNIENKIFSPGIRPLV